MDRTKPIHGGRQDQSAYINYLPEFALAGLSGKAVPLFPAVMVAPFILCTMLGLALAAITLHKYAQTEVETKNGHNKEHDNNEIAGPDNLPKRTGQKRAEEDKVKVSHPSGANQLLG